MEFKSIEQIKTKRINVPVFFKNVEDNYFKGMHSTFNKDSLVKNPYFLFRLKINGEIFNDVRGELNLPAMNCFDNLVFDIKGVPLSQQDDFYKNNDVVVQVFSVKDGEIVCRIFKAVRPRNWMKRIGC